MYEKNDLQISVAKPSELCGNCYTAKEFHPYKKYKSEEVCSVFVQQEKVRHEINSFYGEETPHAVAYLHHSCDEWVIGGRDEIAALIEDLKAMLDSDEFSK